MRIAIFGATSQIAKDYIRSVLLQTNHELVLFARDPERVDLWLKELGFSNHYLTLSFNAFNQDDYFDAIINFVGSGNPAQTEVMGPTIFDVTLKYDELALSYLQRHTLCRYVFLSSGAAYGSVFDTPVDFNTKSSIAINNFQRQDSYGVSKLYAECRHRALPHLPIIDLRVFSYFSHTLDISARFFMTDVIRSIKSKEVLLTSQDNIIRDYIGPNDFYTLICLILDSAPSNDVIDCYTKAPVDKFSLLNAMQQQFGLVFLVSENSKAINATGLKANYYSKNYRAEKFGYIPSKNSLEIVLEETAFAINDSVTTFRSKQA